MHVDLFLSPTGHPSHEVIKRDNEIVIAHQAKRRLLSGICRHPHTLTDASRRSTDNATSMASSLIGTQAPSFGVLKDQHGRPFDSANAFCNGTPTVVFFYPAAMTYGRAVVCVNSLRAYTCRRRLSSELLLDAEVGGAAGPVLWRDFSV